MRELRKPPRRAGALRLLLLCVCLLACARPGLAATTAQGNQIAVIFGDLPPADGVDTNGDGALTAADLMRPLIFNGMVSDLIPHALGDQLVYRVTDPMGKVTMETTTTTSSNPSGAFIVDDLQVDGQKVVSHEMQMYSDTGTQLLFGGETDLFQTITLVTTCSPPLLRLTMPLIAGQMFSTTILCTVSQTNGVPVGTVSRTDAFTPIEVVDTVTVPTGTYHQVVHITGSTMVQGAGVETDEIYLAEGIGAILELSTSGGQTSTHELIAGTIGGVPVH